MSERFPEVRSLTPVEDAIWRFISRDEWPYVDPHNKDIDKACEAKPIPDGEEWCDVAQSELADPILAIICGHRGHQMETDQCGREDHDYCLVCMRRRDKIEEEEKT